MQAVFIGRLLERPRIDVQSVLESSVMSRKHISIVLFPLFLFASAASAAPTLNPQPLPPKEEKVLSQPSVDVLFR